MTRSVLSLLVCALTLAFGLATAHVRCRNHALAARLDATKRECDRLEARIQGLEAETLRQRYRLQDPAGPRPPEPLPEH